MRDTGNWRKQVARVIGLGAALGLVWAGAAAPDAAEATSARFESYRSAPQGGGGTWTGEHSRRWRDGGSRWSHGGWGRHGGGHGGWGHRHWDWGHNQHHFWGPPSPYGTRWAPAPIYIPPRWVWNGWGWVWVPGYWR